MGISAGVVGTEPLAAASARTLSKSDFKLARTCAAKLYFRENGYPDNREYDPYLQLLAEGGYMVEALAKAQHPNGVQLDYGGNVADSYAQTAQALQRENVTLFEATLLLGRRQARVDILEKRGSVVRLIEVKSKSFDGAEDAESKAKGKGGAFRGVKAPYNILAKWDEKLEDVTFQVLLLEKLFPHLTIKPFLVLVDTSKAAQVDNIPSLFELVRREGRNGARLHSARYIGPPELVSQLDLITYVDVSAEVAMLKDDVEEAAALFESRLDAPLAVHADGLERGSKCGKCEFRGSAAGGKDGFGECWGALATAQPHLLELYSVGTAKAPDKTALVPWMLARNTASLLDIPLGGFEIKPDSPGATGNRQRRQVEYTRSNAVYLSDELGIAIQKLQGPLYFIDFETSRLALPYHKGMRPYGLVAFQWSCHTTDAAGGAPRHAEWLNMTDVWPNQSFAESLRGAIGDEGPVLTWTKFEGTTLKQIIPDLEKFGRDVPELVGWMTDVVERRMVDMHDWARCYFYHPGMRGRTSIKVVLDALWKSDEVMRAQCEEWTGRRASDLSDPYAALPSVEINGVPQDVHEGTGAMRAYQEMMYGADKYDARVREQWAELLKQYCALDTLSMVLILEHWRRAVVIGWSRGVARSQSSIEPEA